MKIDIVMTERIEQIISYNWTFSSYILRVIASNVNVQVADSLKIFVKSINFEYDVLLYSKIKIARVSKINIGNRIRKRI